MCLRMLTKKLFIAYLPFHQARFLAGGGVGRLATLAGGAEGVVLVLVRELGVGGFFSCNSG